MDIGSAFTFMFDDEDWIKKIAIGGGIVFVGVLLSPILVGLLLLLPIGGYMIEVLKNVRDGQATPLPEWTDFGGLFKTGLMIAVIAIIYYIPVIVLACGAGATQGFLGSADSDTAAALGFVAVCLNCLQFLVSVLVGFFMPAAFIRYAQHETIGSAFQFAELWSFIRTNIGDYIIVFLLSWVAGIVAGFGLILCLIGIFFTVFWSYLVVGNLYGQLARKAV
ncbi:MAG: DUF4013 domain-containing protein [Chloroflexi bacterium]|nr:MAG: DUF4013 domain-containing protein [Chloroflexota bacterium]